MKREDIIEDETRLLVYAGDLKGQTRPARLIGWNDADPHAVKRKLPDGALGRADVAALIKHTDRLAYAGVTGGRPIVGLHDCPVFPGPVAQPPGEPYWAVVKPGQIKATEA